MVRVFSRVPGATSFVGRIAAGLSVALLLFVAGCASVPPPDNAMNLAQSQLQAARDAHAADYAPVDMGFAEDKFQQAQNAIAQRKYADAATLAAEAQADAELAAAKGRLGTARADIQIKIAENSRLREQGESTPDAAASSATPTAPASQNSLPASQLEGLPAPAESTTATPDNAPQPLPGAFPAQPATAASTMAPLPGAGFQSVQPVQPDQPQPAAAQSAPAVPPSGQSSAHAGQARGARS